MDAKKIFLSLITVMFAIPFFAEANNGVYAVRFPQNRAAAVEAAPTHGNLLYYGGPVISHVKTVVVYWGSRVDPQITQNIGGYYTAMANSTYLDWLDEYATLGTAVDGRKGTQQHIGRGKFVAEVTITPSNPSTRIDDVEIATELQAQIDAGHLPKPDADTLFMTYFPPGVTITVDGMQSCQDLCAYHSFKGAPDTAHFYYGVMPDLGGACAWGCGFGTTRFDSVTAISAHEFMEAITDPFPTPGSNPAYPQAWNTTDGSEIGDICASSGNNSLAAGKLTYAVQSEWDNKSASCTRSNWTSP